MSFPQKVKSALWAIVDNMACNIAQFVKNPGKDFTRDRKLGFVQLIRFFLFMESGCINHELLKYFCFQITQGIQENIITNLPSDEFSFRTDQAHLPSPRASLYPAP